MKFTAKGILICGMMFATFAVITFQYKENNRLQSELDAAHFRKPGRTAPATVAKVAGKVSVDHMQALSKLLAEGDLSPSEMLRQLGYFMDDVKPGEIPDLLRALEKMPDTKMCALLKSALISSWAEQDPRAAIAWAKGLVNDPNRSNYLLAAFEAWSSKDMNAALAAVGQIVDAKTRAEIESSLLARMANLDPQAALAAMLKIPLGQRTSDEYSAVFKSWAQTDPLAASAAAMKLPPSQARDTAIASIACAWSQQDPQAALAWANNLPVGAARADALGVVLASLVSSDPKAASTYLDNFPKGATRNSLITSLASNWAQTDPASAMSWVSNVTGGQMYDRAVEGILVQVSQTDPAKAAAMLANIGDPSILNTALPQLAKEWAKSDVSGALAWARSLPATDGAARASAIQGALETWSQTDPVSAGAYVFNNPTDPNFREMADQVAKSWATADPQAALAWVQTFPSNANAAMDNAARTVLTAMASVDPQTAWDSAQQQAWQAPGPADSRGDPTLNIMAKTLSNITAAWSAQDPAQAAAALQTLPDGYYTQIAATTVMGNWIKQDPEAASQYINTMQPSGMRDNAVAQMVSIEGVNDLPAAFQWAATISNLGMEQSSMSTVVSKWVKADPAAAISAIQSANLTNSQRRALMNDVMLNNKAWVNANMPELVTPEWKPPAH